MSSQLYMHALLQFESRRMIDLAAEGCSKFLVSTHKISVGGHDEACILSYRHEASILHACLFAIQIWTRD